MKPLSLLLLLFFVTTLAIAQPVIPKQNLQIPKWKVDFMIRKTIHLSEKVGWDNIYNSENEYNIEIYKVTRKLISIGKEYNVYKKYYRDILINDKNSKKKLIIATVLSEIGDETLPALLLNLLDDLNPRIRGFAALSLGNMKYEPAKKRLKQIEKSDPDKRVRGVVISILALWDKKR